MCVFTSLRKMCHCKCIKMPLKTIYRRQILPIIIIKHLLYLIYYILCPANQICHLIHIYNDTGSCKCVLPQIDPMLLIAAMSLV